MGHFTFTFPGIYLKAMDILCKKCSREKFIGFLCTFQAWKSQIFFKKKTEVMKVKELYFQFPGYVIHGLL